MKRAAMILAMVVCGVGGFAGAITREEPIAEEREGFSPLFRDRLEVGVMRLDQNRERAWQPLMAGQRVEIIHSGTISSICLASACGGSYCLGSACGGSVCLGSGCVGSNCAGSACMNSQCLGSLCVGSRCLGSACSACAEGPAAEEQA